LEIQNQNVQVICGKLYFEDYKKYNSTTVQVVAFIERMDFVYASADIIISRAGASSVSELSIVGKPVIFPSLMWLKTIKQKTQKLLLIKRSTFERI
jgi:UDP-N-acetylglucosamine--N-acetylmuramyl-(pentapeptide) pyrophosphoryl-undecaprenol N-acetylglucosamine transferase